MKDFSNEIRAYALKNAIEFNKADAGRIIPKLFQHDLKKEDIKIIMPQIIKIVNEINKLSLDEKKAEFEKLKGLIIENEEKEKDLPEIDVSSLNNIVTRLAPEPSKYNHLGHAITFLINYLYAKKYNGQCLLRFEDANPEKVSQEYVDAMKEDVINYLGIKVDSIRFVSDDMSLFYEYAEKLINSNKAYMCFCDRDKMQDLRHKGIECPCRNNSNKKNIEEWKNFVKGKYLEGEAVLRIKGDMKSKNHVMRDSVIFRAVKAKHYKYKDKYKIWPMYDFYNPVEDSLMGVTLILRSNEFDTRVELQDYIKDALGLKKQLIYQYGRINVADFTTKGRETKELVESGKLIGWDDPRLITLKALKRRGIVKESFYELVKQIGLVKHPITLEFNMIAAINRKIIDKTSNRYSFVESPIKLKIKNLPKITEIEVQIHPDKPDERKIKIKDEIFISAEDSKRFKNKEIRLMHLCNVKINKTGNSAEFQSTGNLNVQKIQWVSEGIKTKILMDNCKWTKGIAESAIESLNEGDIIQFERFGFCRLDKKGKEYEFWFSHK